MRAPMQFDGVMDETDISSNVRMAALAAALLALLGPAAALAQDPSPAPARLSERVLREAESPLRWIKIQSESLRRSEDARKAIVPAPDATTSARQAGAKPGPAVPRAPAQPATTAAASSPLLVALAAPTSPRAVKPALAEAPEPPLITIDRADPEWDEALLLRLHHGRVVARFHVATDGYLSRIEIVDSTDSRLTGPTMAALMQWRFEPIPEPRIATAEFGFDQTAH